MEILGNSANKLILYSNIRTDLNWFEKVPEENWVCYLIADLDDKDFLVSAFRQCLVKQVSYSCIAGPITGSGAELFDEEIIRQEKFDRGQLYHSDLPPRCSFHENFSEGFWFSIICAFSGDLETGTVVCLDFTKRGSKKHLQDLIKKINNGWIPSNDKIEFPKYDDEFQY